MIPFVAHAAAVALVIAGDALATPDAPAPAAVTAGDADTTLRLSLADALARAAATAPRLRRLEALERGAAADVRLAAAQRHPTLDLTAGYARHSDVPALTIDRPGLGPKTIFPNLPNELRSRIELDVPTYLGGRVRHLTDAAEHERLAASRDRAGGDLDLRLAVTHAYWSLVVAREQQHVLEETLASHDAHLKQAHDREDVGVAARNEVLAVRVDRDRARLEQLAATNAADVVAAELRRLIDLPATTRIVPTDALALPSPPPSDVEPLVARALEVQPQRAALRERLAAAESRALAERAGRRPVVGILAGYDYGNPNRRILPPEDSFRGTWDVGVNVSVPVLDGGRTAAALARSQAQLDVVKSDLDDAERGIRLEVESRVLDARTALARADVAQGALLAAHESRRVAADRYLQGVIASADLLDAERMELLAGLDRVRAIADALLARAALERALGGPP